MAPRKSKEEAVAAIDRQRPVGEREWQAERLTVSSGRSEARSPANGKLIRVHEASTVGAALPNRSDAATLEAIANSRS